ncbi:coat protein [Solanum nodiflorum mottle virus]|uniref:Capsid protein n=1 Tax=Solanum nodiflorum mottle virus TaxID=12471 RepID=A0A1P7XK56_9VIRU|nr:coat protein [Solanum nodiflorum mottle virus]AHB64349.1 coat protein [Solanum nodiflorum mottle virus]
MVKRRPRLRQLTVMERVTERNPPARKSRPRRRRKGGQTTMVTAPIAGTMVYRRNPILMNGRRGITVCHSEVVLAVQSTATAFSATSVTLAPNTFSWLSVMGALFSKWRWISLRATYVPETATTTPGIVAMAFQYDNTDTLPVGNAGMSSLYGYVSGAPWAGFEGSKLLTEKPTTPIPSGAIATQLDCTNFGLKWYQYKAVMPAGDSGNLYVPAQLIVGNLGANNPLRYGEVHIQYEVEFIEPIPPTSNALRSVTDEILKRERRELCVNEPPAVVVNTEVLLPSKETEIDKAELIP